MHTIDEKQLLTQQTHFQRWLAAADMPPLPQRLAVAWSGGADSTALLLALKLAGFDVHAWHVDHGWRASSTHEARQLSARAQSLAIPFRMGRLADAPATNREAHARQGRYALFEAWSRQSGIDTLCLGHHRNDQAETVCMRMLQGAGPGGCRGMQRERRMGGLRLVRPLLHVPGEQLKHVLRAAGVSWFEDPSNRDETLWRNKIRRRLFPCMARQGVVEPVDLFLRWQQQAVRVDAALDRAAGRLLQAADDGGFCLWRAWQTATPAVRARLLQRGVRQLLGDGITPGRRHIELVEIWTQQGGRGGIDLSACRLERRKDRLHLKKAQARFDVSSR